MDDPTAEPIGAELTDFLSRCRWVGGEHARWPGGMELAVDGYLTDELPPLELVTSVRAVVLRGGEVLVLANDNERHILPGGRRERGETREATPRREVLEETGWMVRNPRLLGCVVLRHSTPRPSGYQFPYPAFIHVVYAADADAFQPKALCPDEIDGVATFIPVAEARILPLSAHQHAFLDAAVSGRLLLGS